MFYHWTIVNWPNNEIVENDKRTPLIIQCYRPNEYIYIEDWRCLVVHCMLNVRFSFSTDEEELQYVYEMFKKLWHQSPLTLDGTIPCIIQLNIHYIYYSFEIVSGWATNWGSSSPTMNVIRTGNTRAKTNWDGKKPYQFLEEKMVARIEAYLPNKLKEPTIAIESPNNYYQTIATKQNLKK